MLQDTPRVVLVVKPHVARKPAVSFSRRFWVAVSLVVLVSGDQTICIMAKHFFDCVIGGVLATASGTAVRIGIGVKNWQKAGFDVLLS